MDYDFDSSADVIAFIGLRGIVYVRFSCNLHLSSFQRNSNMEINVYLWTMSDGQHHPAARSPEIHHHLGTRASYISSVSITSLRLMVVVRMGRLKCLVIFDWRDGRVLFVSEFFW